MRKLIIPLIFLLGCGISESPRTEPAKTDDFIIYSCQPKPDTSPRNLELPALVTTQCVNYKFKIGLPENWKIRREFYPVCLDEKSGRYQRHEVFAITCAGPHNASGYGRISFIIDASPKVGNHAYNSFDEFIKDRNEDHQHEKNDPKLEKLDNKYLSYKFLWPKLIGREYFNQYTQVVFFEGSKYYYEVQYHAEEPDLQHFMPLYIKVLNSFEYN